MKKYLAITGILLVLVVIAVALESAWPREKMSSVSSGILPVTQLSDQAPSQPEPEGSTLAKRVGGGAKPVLIEGGGESEWFIVKDGKVMLCYWDGTNCEIMQAVADPKTFEVVYESEPVSFEKDSIYLYLVTNALPGVDSSTFKYIDSYNYILDKYHVYKLRDGGVEILPGIDPTSFQIYPSDFSNESPFARDKNHFLCFGEVLAGLDPDKTSFAYKQETNQYEITDGSTSYVTDSANGRCYK